MDPKDTQNGGPAFPVDPALGDAEGMSLRDYFAAKAMEGLIVASGIEGVKNGGKIFAELCTASYAYADQMLRARQA